jgi:DnaK suppressor protein
MATKKKTRKKAVTKKKTTKKRSPSKKTAPKKKAAKKKLSKKKAPAKKKVAKKKAAKKKKTVKKKAAKKTKTTKKKVAKKSPGKKSKAAKLSAVPAEKASSAPNKKVLGKNNLLSLKSKQFRRSPGEVQSFKPYRAASGEEFMNTDQTEHFRTILQDWKRLLMEEVDRTVHHMQDEAANFPDPNDRATQEEEFALELRTRDRERKLIRKIDEAMLRLDTGDFGYCEICGVEIGIKRLEARPTATLCIDCKTLDEIKEKQLG